MIFSETHNKLEIQFEETDSQCERDMIKNALYLALNTLRLIIVAGSKEGEIE